MVLTNYKTFFFLRKNTNKMQIPNAIAVKIEKRFGEF